jgi:DNA-binding transcriptional MocR family regulator
MSAMTPAYQRIADDIAGQIHSGRIAAGSRLPSVRELAAQRKVSIATAIGALRALEFRELVEARPRSGYFARLPPPAAPEPPISRPPSRTRSVKVSDVITQMFSTADAQAPRSVPLGAAFPDPELLPTQALQRATARLARTSPRLLSGYGPLEGSPRLRRWIAARYLRSSTAIDASELVVTNGGMEALQLALRAVCVPGDAVAVESPCYFGFLQVLETLNLKACEIPTHPRSGLSVEALERVLNSPTGRSIKACLLCPTHSNPLGATMTDADKAALVELCRRHKVALIEDDLYGELQYTERRPLPLRHFDPQGEVMLCSSFSKTLAPGARVGFIAAGRNTERVRALKFAASVSTAPLMQEALAKVLDGSLYDRHLRRLRAACEQQVQQAMRCILEAFPEGTRAVQPSGGFLLWVQLPDGADTLALYRRAAMEGVEFAPGPLFSSRGAFVDSLRLNCGHRMTPRIEAAFRRLGELARTA